MTKRFHTVNKQFLIIFKHGFKIKHSFVNSKQIFCNLNGLKEKKPNGQNFLRWVLIYLPCFWLGRSSTGRSHWTFLKAVPSADFKPAKTITLVASIEVNRKYTKWTWNIENTKYKVFKCDWTRNLSVRLDCVVFLDSV